MKLSKFIFPPPFKARHYKRTFIASLDDEASRPTRSVIECALAAVHKTLDVDVCDISRQMKSPLRWPDTWPGEHYRLMAGFVAHLQPKVVIEIGTHTGISALCLLKYLRRDGKLVTFDLVPWDTLPDTCLRYEDFADGRFEQQLDDLADPDSFKRHAPLLSKAEPIFVDGPKDKAFEPQFVQNLDTLTFEKDPWVIFDDIHRLVS